MAVIKDMTNVGVADSGREAFDQNHSPGETVQLSGIYRCRNCSREAACNKGDPFPPQSHAQHPNGPPIIWYLLVYAQG